MTSAKAMSRNWPKISWQLSQSLPRAAMASASTELGKKLGLRSSTKKKEKKNKNQSADKGDRPNDGAPTGKPVQAPRQTKTHKIRIWPTEEQRLKVSKWMDAARWTYNKTVDAVMQAMQRKQAAPEKQETRRQLVNKSLLATHPGHEWLLETPAGIRDKAWKQVYSALRMHRTLKRRRFQLKHRRRKDRSQTIKIDARDYGHKRGEFAWLTQLRCAEPLPPRIECEFEILKTWTGEFYLLIPMHCDVVNATPTKVPGSDSQAPARRVVSIDPGVRTFATCYDPSGVVYEVGTEDRGRLCKLSWGADKLQRKIKEAQNHRQRYRMKRAQRRLFEKRKHLVDDLHHQLAYWLCSEFDDIIITTYRGSEMTRRLGRRLNRETTRQMLTWSYYRFKQHLAFKAHLTGRRLFVVDEAYTSRTCGACGTLKEKTGSKHFSCRECGAQIDRDFNGARNILLRTLSI
jgi:putative transposase